MLHNFMTSRLRRLVRVCLAVISLTAFSHRIFKHKTIDKIFHVMFVFVHNPPIFPLLLTYSLKINSSLVLTHAVYTGRPTASSKRRGVTGSRVRPHAEKRRRAAMQHARGIRRTTAVEKVLSLATFRYTFVRENVTSLSDGFLLVFFIKNFMSSAC